MSKDKDPKEAPPAAEPKMFDVRTVERNIKRGVQTRKDYEKYLKGLPDSKDKVRPAE